MDPFLVCNMLATMSLLMGHGDVILRGFLFSIQSLSCYRAVLPVTARLNNCWVTMLTLN